MIFREKHWNKDEELSLAPFTITKKKKKKKEDEEADIKWGKMKVQRKINERAMTRLVGGGLRGRGWQRN